MNRLSADQMRIAVKNGLRPPGDDKSSAFQLLGMASDEWHAQWINQVEADTTDWGLCPDCYASAASLPCTAVTPPATSPAATFVAATQPHPSLSPRDAQIAATVEELIQKLRNAPSIDEAMTQIQYLRLITMDDAAASQIAAALSDIIADPTLPLQARSNAAYTLLATKGRDPIDEVIHNLTVKGLLDPILEELRRLQPKWWQFWK